MLSYVERGRGPALIFIHAFPLDHTMWAHQVEIFSAHYRVITPDVRGFGGSRPASSWMIRDMVEELEDLAVALDVDRCAIVGLSMGGYIALNYALKYRNRVQNLVLAHTRGRADNNVERQKRDDMIVELELQGIRALPATMLARLLKPNAPPELVEQVRQTILDTDPIAAAHAVAALRDRPDATPFLSSISCPTLVIAGQEDVILKLEDCRELAAALPNARLASIPDAGHLSNLENPHAFNAALEEFLG